MGQSWDENGNLITTAKQSWDENGNPVKTSPGSPRPSPSASLPRSLNQISTPPLQDSGFFSENGFGPGTFSKGLGEVVQPGSRVEGLYHMATGGLEMGLPFALAGGGASLADAAAHGGVGNLLRGAAVRLGASVGTGYAAERTAAHFGAPPIVRGAAGLVGGLAGGWMGNIPGFALKNPGSLLKWAMSQGDSPVAKAIIEEATGVTGGRPVELGGPTLSRSPITGTLEHYPPGDPWAEPGPGFSGTKLPAVTGKGGTPQTEFTEPAPRVPQPPAYGGGNPSKYVAHGGKQFQLNPPPKPFTPSGIIERPVGVTGGTPVVTPAPVDTPPPPVPDTPPPAAAPEVPPTPAAAPAPDVTATPGKIVTGHDTVMTHQDWADAKIKNISEYLRSRGGTAEDLDKIVQNPKLTDQLLKEAKQYGVSVGNKVPKGEYGGLDPNTSSHIGIRDALLKIIEAEKNQ